MKILVPIIAVVLSALMFWAFAVNHKAKQEDPAADTATVADASDSSDESVDPTADPSTGADLNAADAPSDASSDGSNGSVNDAETGPVNDPVDGGAVVPVDGTADSVDPGAALTAGEGDASSITSDAVDSADSAEAAAPNAFSAMTVDEASAVLGLALNSDKTVVIGDSDRDQPFQMALTISRMGAGIQQIDLSDFRERVDPDSEPYQILNNDPPASKDTPPAYWHYQILDLYVDGVQVLTRDEKGIDYPVGSTWWGHGTIERTESGESIDFHMVVANAEGTPVVHVKRTFTLSSGRHEVQVQQQIASLDGQPHRVRLNQNLQADIAADERGYMGDRRRFVVGSFRPEDDPGQVRVFTDDGFFARRTLLKGKKELWPPRNRPLDEMAWLTAENRYFAVTTHGPMADVTETSELTPLTDIFVDIGSYSFPGPGEGYDDDQRVFVITATTGELVIPADGSVSRDFDFFAGPVEKDLLRAEPFAFLQLDQIRKYELGCTICTFQPLARGLLNFLKFIHNLVGDWGVAIIVLVLVVRGILHPITKRSQTNMMIFGKQMSRLQPEILKLKEKYGDEPQKFQQEQMKLWREHGVNPLRMLGCLPMLLQTPIWIALYAVIFLAVELRHQPAFYGIFQEMGGWSFLEDLSRADRFFEFSKDEKVISLGLMVFDYSAFNILPLIWLCINLVNMTLMTPPAMTDQAKSQQKMMKIMMSLFGIFLYSAPSALTLYMCASTSIGILDAYIVRRHVKKLEAEGKLDPDHPESIFKKKPPKPVKPGSFKWKLQQRMENAQKMMEAQRQAQERGTGTGSGGGGGNRAVRRATKNRKK